MCLKDSPDRPDAFYFDDDYYVALVITADYKDAVKMRESGQRIAQVQFIKQKDAKQITSNDDYIFIKWC